MLFHNLLLICTLAFTAKGDSDTLAQQWSGWGGNYYNNRFATNSPIASPNIKSIINHCNVSYPIGISATPVVSGNIAYYPVWNGSFAALDFVSCRILWSINVTAIVESYGPLTKLQSQQVKPISRTSPQIDGKTLYFGTLAHALIVAVNRMTGQLLGTVQINPHPLAIVTMSPTFFDGKLFVGASSWEENAATDPTYKCCSFVGNMVALSFSGTKFTVLWNVPMISSAQASLGWAGGALWGSQPAIDPKNRQVFIATGNTYSLPQVILDCQLVTQNISAVQQHLVSDSCLPENVWQESVLAIDIDLGIVNWVHQLSALDSWTIACGVYGLTTQNHELCPEIPGPDSDFGMAPTFVPGSASTPYGKDILILGQKNGNLYAFSAQTGTVFWTTVTSPDGVGGGLSWGLAVDNSQVYFTAINYSNKQWILQPSKQVSNRSAYGAASLLTGKLLWEVPVPGNGVAHGPPSVVGDLVLVVKTGTDSGTGNYDRTQGALVALNKNSGVVEFQTDLSTNSHGGVAIQGNYVMLGTGYTGFTAPAVVPGGINVWTIEPRSSSN